MKEVYFIRHAESVYNEFKKKPSTWLCCMGCRDPKIYDPALSAKGVEQVKALRQRVLQQGLDKIAEVVFVSPLSRALDTCIGAFPPEIAETKIEVSPDVREVMDTCGDIGQNATDLEQRYEDLDFSSLENNWWYFESAKGPNIPAKEPKAVLLERQNRFTQMLQSREESVIVVVSHSMFIKTLTGGLFKLPNCGIKKTVLTDAGRFESVQKTSQASSSL
eukprot:CAMPEP_0175120004 /NCGR_PEP_ID=MMETSP0087-20121206/381_1 /TAXON_ID=136419 /ORGANISM="Unknown Unknown, Strain D1" /LENGTH=218 /DNA_ID=CAMNT_0016401405 /DNA_START=45 /DNA_END=701 /DNA_ORIENTATION=-